MMQASPGVLQARRVGVAGELVAVVPLLLYPLRTLRGVGSGPDQGEPALAVLADAGAVGTPVPVEG